MDPRAMTLQVRGLVARRAGTPVLHGVDLDLRPGEIVALLGRNGAGRSTTAMALMGLVPAGGQVLWRGRELTGLAPHEIARLGLGYVPEGREVFPTLTVHQNLLLGEQAGRHGASNDGFLHGRDPAPWTLDDLYALFPALRERQHAPAGVLSGGEQQMLALCRTLMGQPRLMLVDEPTEGLAPAVARQVARCLQALRERGVGVLLIEQKLGIAMELADRVLVMGRGRLVFDGTPDRFLASPDIRREWLEV